LFFLRGEQLMAVDVYTKSDRFEVEGTPKALFNAAIANPLRNAYVASPDGQRFLVNTRIQTKNTLQLTVVVNWPAGVKL
jgi:hypothetical protein